MLSIFFRNIFWVDLMIEIFLPGMVNSVIFCLKDFLWQFDL